MAALPRKLKFMNVFNDGDSYLGQLKTATLPKLTRTMKEWKGGGMDGAVKIDVGQELLEFEATYGGLMIGILRQYGIMNVAGVGLRFVGSYQRPDDGQVDAVEVVIRGQHEEIDMGDAEQGEDTEFKVKTPCAYYKLSINGRTEIEIDLLNMIMVVDGVDRLAAHRAALGV
ncbi:MAG: phage major tail tube protein [Phenylobacterium sp.]|nr:phage major tail tube protein [Phenylobacterium sp.]